MIKNVGEILSKESFSDINVDDPFFDSLKSDYPGMKTVPVL